MIHVEYFYYACFTIGFLLLILFPMLNTFYWSTNNEPKKYVASEYLTNVFLPSTFGVVLVAIAYIGLNYLNYNERKLAILTYSMALIASAFASTSIMVSLSRLRWAAD
jgi:hypothetical protein